MQAVLKPASARPKAARRPAPPAPTTIASYSWSCFHPESIGSALSTRLWIVGSGSTYDHRVLAAEEGRSLLCTERAVSDDAGCNAGNQSAQMSRYTILVTLRARIGSTYRPAVLWKRPGSGLWGHARAAGPRVSLFASRESAKKGERVWRGRKKRKLTAGDAASRLQAIEDAIVY